MVRGIHGERHVVVDLQRLDDISEVDTKSRLVTVGAGVTGPRLRAALQKSGFLLGHEPQSHDISTVGGWVATACLRSALCALRRHRETGCRSRGGSPWWPNHSHQDRAASLGGSGYRRAHARIRGHSRHRDRGDSARDTDTRGEIRRVPSFRPHERRDRRLPSPGSVASVVRPWFVPTTRRTRFC